MTNESPGPVMTDMGKKAMERHPMPEGFAVEADVSVEMMLKEIEAHNEAVSEAKTYWSAFGGGQSVAF
jgi:hypothetical protein